MVFLAVFFNSFQSFSAGPRPVYIIPIEGEVEKGLIWLVRRGITEAEENDAQAIVLRMNTNGGAADATQEIMELLARTEIDTYTYVDIRAFSAGAYIAVATRHIYMAPGSMIGAATPIAAVPGMGPAKMDEAVAEKMTSAFRAMIAASAEMNGHPVEVVEAMVDRDVEIPGVIGKGKLLTLTNTRAADPEVGLSEGTVESLGELLEITGMGNVSRVEIETTPAEKLARFLTGSMVTMLLLGGGLAGLYFEIKTPGFGLPGIAGIILLALFFFGHNIAGLAGMEEVALFLVGLLLLFIELFITPGFGLLGGTGIILIVGSLIAAMGSGPVFNPETVLSRNYLPGLMNFGGALLGLFLLVLLTYRFVFVKTSPLYGKFVLTAEEKKEAGFESSKSGLDRLKGAKGKTFTKLRPAGKALIGGKTVDVVSRGEFIEPNTDIEVIETEGSRVVVRTVKSGKCKVGSGKCKV